MGRWRLVIRHGPRVERESFDDLDDALAAMKRQTQLIRKEGPLDEVSAIREYEPAQRVHARLVLSSGRLLRRREAGMDLMGDGTLVPYIGLVRKRALEPAQGQSPFEAVRAALA
jgi:hypothetical protein